RLLRRQVDQGDVPGGHLPREGGARPAAPGPVGIEAQLSRSGRDREEAAHHLSAARHRQLLGLLQPQARPRGGEVMKIAAVVGLGTMGPGIAATLAKGGMDVRTYDVKPEVVKGAKALVETAFTVLDRIGRPKADRVGTVSYHDDLAQTVADADLVVESVPERP